MKAAWLGCLVVLASGRTFAAERVVFCEPQVDACVHASRLGDAPPRGWWAATDDGSIITAARTGQRVPAVLYESKAAYQEAIAGLRGKEVEAAILKRLASVRERPIAAAPGFLFGVAREDMLGVIRAAGPGDQAIVEGTLAAAVALAGGEETFKDLSPGETITRAREPLARLQVELKDGPVSAGYEREARRLTTLLARFRPGQAKGAPFASPERAYFAPDEPPPGRIDGELFVDQPWYAWRGGTVLVLRSGEAAEARWSKSKLRLMYFDRATFYHDISSLTDAQMNRRLSARLKGPPADELAALISRLAFDHAVFMHQATAVQASEPAARAEWGEVVALATDNLRQAIPPAAREPAPNLTGALARLREDVALLDVLAHASTTPSLTAPLVDRFQAAVGRLPK